MRRWSRSLAGHVVAAQAVAGGVFAVAVVVIRAGLGAPRPAADAALTPTNQLEIAKLALAVVAGVGGVVALVVAYRRQAVVEEDNDRARATARRCGSRRCMR